MAQCNGFKCAEIELGTCDQAHGCDSCASKNGYCNWYTHWYDIESTALGECVIALGDGLRCVKPALLRTCPGNNDKPVCATSANTKYFFDNPCLARALGFEEKIGGNGDDEGFFVLENCTEGTAVDARDDDQAFQFVGDSRASLSIEKMGPVPYGQLLYPRDDFESTCDCAWNYEPVCLKTGYQDATFYNLCLLNCKNQTQRDPLTELYIYTYWPDEATVVSGECPELCIGFSCEEDEVCSSQFGTPICVPIDTNVCEERIESAGDFDQFDNTCVEILLPAVPYSVWTVLNRRAAEDCLGAREGNGHYFAGSCFDRCYEQDCTQTERDGDLCVYVDGKRVTYKICDAYCNREDLTSTDFLLGACEGTDCVKNCPIEKDAWVCSMQPGRFYKTTFDSRCAATCNGLVDLEKLLSGKCDDPQPPVPVCSPIDSSCCDVSRDKAIAQLNQYGACDEYVFGRESHEFCNEPLDSDFWKESDWSHLPNIAAACPFACGLCTQRSTGSYCESTSQCVDGLACAFQPSAVSNVCCPENNLYEDSVFGRPTCAPQCPTNNFCQAIDPKLLCSEENQDGEKYCYDKTTGCSADFDTDEVCCGYRQGDVEVQNCPADKPYCTRSSTYTQGLCVEANPCGPPSQGGFVDLIPEGKASTVVGGLDTFWCYSYRRGVMPLGTWASNQEEGYPNHVYCFDDVSSDQNLGSRVIDVCQKSCHCAVPPEKVCDPSTDCCDLDADGDVTDFGDCAFYASRDGFGWCDFDELRPEFKGFGRTYAKDVCRKSCRYCNDFCVDVDLPAEVSIWGSCPTYGANQVNKDFCDLDEPTFDMRDAGWGVHSLCRSSCRTCTSQGPRLEIIDGIPKQPPLVNFPRDVPSLECTAEECCDHYQPWETLNELGDTCASYANNRGKKNRYGSCPVDLVSSPRIDVNGEPDNSFVNRPVSEACRLSCDTCYSRCDVSQQCCDAILPNPVSNFGGCEMYVARSNPAIHLTCYSERYSYQIAETDITVAQVCAKSCGCCFDEYAKEKVLLTNDGAALSCADFATTYTSQLGAGALCVPRNRNNARTVEKYFLWQSQCDKACHVIEESGDAQCYGFEWTPQEIEFGRIVTGQSGICKLYLDEIEFAQLIPSIPDRDYWRTECFKKGAYSGDGDIHIVNSGSKSGLGYRICDVCSQSCGRCQSTKYDPSLDMTELERPNEFPPYLLE